jgi:hypothetical protein
MQVKVTTDLELLLRAGRPPKPFRLEGEMEEWLNAYSKQLQLAMVIVHTRN